MIQRVGTDALGGAGAEKGTEDDGENEGHGIGGTAIESMCITQLFLFFGREILHVRQFLRNEVNGVVGMVVHKDC